jgi:hypothetical protein
MNAMWNPSLKIGIVVAQAFLPVLLHAQQPVAPTAEQAGTVRGDNIGNYNITQSFETGYRWSLTGGDLGMYRSVVNYGNGIRLLGSNLTVNSKEGHGHYFDEILLNTIGLGNDPYQAAILRIQKNRLYRYDMTWRLNAYYSPGLTVAGGTHLRNTSRRVQDHDLTLLPQSHYRLRVGYSRNTEDGPALSTAQEFDVNGFGLPVFNNVRRNWTEYRLGADLEFHGFQFAVTHRWDYFKDDSGYSLVPGTASPSASDRTSLTDFVRGEPVHGANPGWLGNLFTKHQRWGANARMTYVSGRRDFIEDEIVSGSSSIGNPITRAVVVGGKARRPVLAGDLGINLFPTERFTVVNNFSITNNRIDGNSTYSEFITGLNLGTTIYFRSLGIRTVTNSTDVQYRARPWIGFYAGYRFSDRRIRTVDTFSFQEFGGSADTSSYTVSNSLHSGIAGVRIRPWKPFSINLEGEVGRADAPLTPIADRNYHAINGRAEYRLRRVQLSTSYRQAYNLNSSAPLTAFSSHSRNYSANASWTPKDGFSFDASYMKLHLDTQSGIAFFASPGNRPQLQSGFQSLFDSNVHAANVAAHFMLRKRADLYVGYSITKDIGDGRAAAVPASVTDPVQTLLTSVQVFPLTYQSPLARLSIRISPKVRWNAGWQYYGYGEEFHVFGFNQNYHAHTGYTSVLWAF